MNFFEHQEQARKKTGRLVILFGLTVLAIIAACYFPGLVVAAAIDAKITDQEGFVFNWWRWDVLACVAAITVVVIAIGSLWKTHTLSGGGAVVATEMGGKLVNPHTDDPDERKLLNVVEEIAIASGVAVPLVFVLNEEKGINAFAAGYTPNDAAVAVTRGCLQLLNRDELQGVIAHEFSHVLNGDMRLNIRLIGIVFGILALAVVGKTILYSMAHGTRVRSSRQGGGAIVAIMVLGGLLCVIGYIGVFFGRIIKAAVSRQREFLADASAVAFTRNPDGLAGALKKIGGYKHRAHVLAPAAEEASHMFFGNAMSESVLFANAMSTHPPLAERVHRIDPSFTGEFPKVKPPKARPASRKKAGKKAGAKAATMGFLAADTLHVDPGQIVNRVAVPTIDHLAYGAELIAAMPSPVRSAAHDAVGAVATVFALLLDSDEGERSRQIAILRKYSEPVYVEEMLRLAAKVAEVHPGVRLSLAGLTVPALRGLTPTQYEAFRKNVVRLVVADRKISIFEFALQKLLLRRLAASFGKANRKDVRYKAFSPLLPDCVLVLSFLARAGHDDVAAAGRAFQKASSRLPKTETTAPTIVPPEQCDFKALDLALDHLALASPIIKQRVVDACARCVLADGTVTVKEAELLRAVTDTLDCPLPPFLPSAGKAAE